MKLIKHALILSAILLATGCGKGGDQSSNGGEVITKVKFDGLDEGCKLAYDALFCPPTFKSGNLQAGKATEWKYYILPNDDNVYKVSHDTALPKQAKIVVEMVDINASIGGE